MTRTANTPTLSELTEAGVGAVEIICQMPNCKRQAVLDVEVFDARETVLTLAAKARCSACGCRNAEIYPVWNRSEMFGSPICAYGPG